MEGKREVGLLEMGSEEKVLGKSRKKSRDVKGHARRRRRTEMREAEDVGEGGVKGTGRSPERTMGEWAGGEERKRRKRREIH